jgi:hypothetical protein
MVSTAKERNLAKYGGGGGSSVKYYPGDVIFVEQVRGRRVRIVFAFSVPIGLA